MNWLIFSILAYFLLALSITLDKILLRRRINKPAVYAFYVALFSLASIILIPFGLHWIGWVWLAVSILAGIIFVYALLFFYYAVQENEISKVAPLVGVVMQIATFIIAVSFLNEGLTSNKVFGLIFLIVGGFLVSFDWPFKFSNILKGFKFSLLSGIFFAIAYSLFDYVYNGVANIFAEGAFVSGFIWTRLGLAIGGFSLLLFKEYRQSIFNSFRGKEKQYKKRRSPLTILLFLLNKIFGGGASLLINHAIFLGTATMVNAVNSIQFVFVLFLATIASLKYPKIFEEKLSFSDWTQKISAILIIALGIWLLAV